MKLSKSALASLTASLLVSVSAYAGDLNNNRPDAHAPIGVVRDHIHKKGGVMLSYRYSSMRMKGSLKGDNNISPADVSDNGYMMAPLKMDMKMHMLGGMYGVTDNLSLMAMGSFMTNSMKMNTDASSQVSSQNISGFGDTKINAMYGFYKDADSHAQFNLGVSIPTGSIKKNEAGSRASYSMQLGSGSYELLPGLSYMGFKESYSYGGQVNGQFRLGYNNSGYKLGDSYNVTTWASKKLNEAFSLSSRLNYTVTERTKGYYSGLNTMSASMMSPMNDSTYSGGRRLDFLLGTNFVVPSGALKGHRLALEGGVPLYQKVNGIQMRNAYNVTFGWQKSF